MSNKLEDEKIIKQQDPKNLLSSSYKNKKNNKLISNNKLKDTGTKIINKQEQNQKNLQSYSSNENNKKKINNKLISNNKLKGTGTKIINQQEQNQKNFKSYSSFDENNKKKINNKLISNNKLKGTGTKIINKQEQNQKNLQSYSSSSENNKKKINNKLISNQLEGKKITTQKKKKQKQKNLQFSSYKNNNKLISNKLKDVGGKKIIKPRSPRKFLSLVTRLFSADNKININIKKDIKIFNNKKPKKNLLSTSSLSHYENKKTKKKLKQNKLVKNSKIIKQLKQKKKKSFPSNKKDENLFLLRSKTDNITTTLKEKLPYIFKNVHQTKKQKLQEQVMDEIMEKFGGYFEKIKKKNEKKILKLKEKRKKLEEKKKAFYKNKNYFAKIYMIKLCKKLQIYKYSKGKAKALLSSFYKGLYDFYKLNKIDKDNEYKNRRKKFNNLIFDNERNEKLLKYFKFIFYQRFNIKNKIKKNVAFLSIKKKFLFFYNFVLNYDNWAHLLNKILYINLARKKKNFFLNYSHHQGNIISKYSAGFYVKGSLKKRVYAIDQVLKKSLLNIKYKNFKKILYLNIKSNFKGKSLKKNIEKFLNCNKIKKFYKINNSNYKAHNGVRKKNKRRK